MARDLLAADWDKGHLYRHDLESLFYIILILSCHYTGPTTFASSLAFKDWFDGVDHVIAALKFAFLVSSSEITVQAYFGRFSNCLLIIRRILAMGYLIRQMLRMGYKTTFYLDEEEEIQPDVYNWDTLGGNITYAKMVQVMRSFEENHLVTRWDRGHSSN